MELFLLVAVNGRFVLPDGGLLYKGLTSFRFPRVQGCLYTCSVLFNGPHIFLRAILRVVSVGLHGNFGARVGI